MRELNERDKSEFVTKKEFDEKIRHMQGVLDSHLMLIQSTVEALGKLAGVENIK